MFKSKIYKAIWLILSHEAGHILEKGIARVIHMAMSAR